MSRPAAQPSQADRELAVTIFAAINTYFASREMTLRLHLNLDHELVTRIAAHVAASCEELRRKIQVLEEYRDNAQISLRDFEKAAEALRERCHQKHDLLIASEARAKRLEDALRPFAEFAKIHRPMRGTKNLVPRRSDDQIYSICAPAGDASITVGHIDEAARALEENT